MELRKGSLGKILNCEICTKPIKINPSRLKNKYHTCSHKCSGILKSKRFSAKIKVNCTICKKEIYYKQSHIKEIAYPTCSYECAAKIRSITYKKDNNPRALKLNEEDRYFWNKTKELANRAKAKKIPFDLDYQFLKELYYKQNGLCYYSKIQMLLKSPPNLKCAVWNVLSVDKIDSNKGYTKDNIVFALNCINMLKSSHDLEIIKQVFKAIGEVENAKSKV